MAKKDYTVRVEPISRVPEKIFGWLGWLALLAIVIFIAYLSFALVKDPEFVNVIREQSINMANEQGISAAEVESMVLDSIGNMWILSLIGVIPLIISFIGLIKMRKRILAGVLLLITAIIIAPFIITLFSSLMFVIAAILLFVRKDKETIVDEFEHHDNRNINNYDDDVRIAKDKRVNHHVDNYEEDDLEKTRMFEAIDEDDYKETRLNEDEEIVIRGGSNESQDAKRLRRENVNRRNED